MTLNKSSNAIPNPLAPATVLEGKNWDHYLAMVKATNLSAIEPSRGVEKPVTLHDELQIASRTYTFPPKGAIPTPTSTYPLGKIVPTSTEGPYPALPEADDEEYMAICMTGKSITRQFCSLLQSPISQIFNYLPC